VNAWIGQLFDGSNIDRTVAALVASQDGGSESVGYDAAKKRLADAKARLGRFQEAIASGVDPAALVDVINEAQTQRATAQAELAGTPVPTSLADAEVYAMVDALGDVGAASPMSRTIVWQPCTVPSTCKSATSQRRTSPTWASVLDDG
jgi:hypothetical protein